MLVEQKKKTLHRHDRMRNCLESNVVRFSGMCRDRGQISFRNKQLTTFYEHWFNESYISLYQVILLPSQKTDNSVSTTI